MKVKNIMFSGAMAAILGVTGANAAVTVASQGYVDSKIQGVETNVANTYLTQEDAADTYLTETQVTKQITNVIAAEDGAVATAQAAADKAQGEVDALETVVAGKADSATTLEGYGITDAYTKTEVDEKVAEVVAGDMTEALTAYAKTADVESTYATKDALSAVETTANAAATKIYVDTELGKKADTTAVEAITNSLSDYATTEALNAVKTTADAAATKTYVDTEFAKYTTTADLNTTLDTFATKQALENEETARKAADEAATSALSGKQDSLNEAQLAAVNSGVTSATVAQVATNTEEIAKKANANTLTLLATANVPEECQSESNTCVLSMTSDGTFAWTPLTATPTVAE